MNPLSILLTLYSACLLWLPAKLRFCPRIDQRVCDLVVGHQLLLHDAAAAKLNNFIPKTLETDWRGDTLKDILLKYFLHRDFY